MERICSCDAKHLSHGAGCNFHSDNRSRNVSDRVLIGKAKCHDGQVKILVIGGTRFLGRSFVDVASANGHELTLFSRGQVSPNPFPDIEQIHGDRGVDLSGLDGRTWDAVFDTCGYFPRVVGMSTEALKDRCGRYLFISSISVFKNFDIPNQDEDGEVATLRRALTKK